MAKWYRSGAVMTNTSLRNGGRIAGAGTAYDDYSEESGHCPGPGKHSAGAVRMPHDGENPDDLNGPVIIVQPAKK